MRYPCGGMNCPSGSSEVPGNGRFGPLVPVVDESELEAAMEHVLDSPPPEKDMLLARAKEFSFDASIDLYGRIVFGLVHRTCRRQPLHI